ncbi:restriction endonuclease subunit S [Streptomyces sp. NBC_01089]|uniref:restriction endonuclease subunit S n=1 Tax=Streptomyces sp. NBC_01089 TaxID=2903747 RepID=UPI003868C5E1|nr:restriction endonuclease subunit S [Streptomyces sp. NBC_01089]
MTSFRIKDVARINRHVLPETTDPDFRFRYIDISSVDGLGNVSVPDSDTVFSSAPSRARRTALPNSVLVSTVRTYLRAVAVAPDHEYPLVFSTGFAILDAEPEVCSRFLGYYCRSQPFIDEVVARSTGVSYPAINASEIGNLPIWLPSLDEQLRIADFLDAETARIDRLVDLQKRVVDKLNEREAAQLDIAIDELISRSATAPLRRFVWRVDQGVSPQCEAVPASDEEWGVLKVSCLRPGVFNPGENKRLPDDLQPERSSEVREGDLLITRANTPQLVGSTAVVPKVRSKLLLPDKIFRVRLSEGMMPEFVATIARGSRIRSLSAAGSNGASQSMANIRFEEVKGWPVPAVKRAAQEEFVDRIARSREQLDALRSLVDRQITLLSERRQALITAAVTGQFDVSTASGRNVTDGVQA